MTGPIGVPGDAIAAYVSETQYLAMLSHWGDLWLGREGHRNPLGQMYRPTWRDHGTP